MYCYCFFCVLFLCKIIASVETLCAAVSDHDKLKLRFALHQTLETALISPFNLFKLREVFFPRGNDVIIFPVSVQVTYNLTCEEPRNYSFQTEDDSFCSDGECIASFFWTSLPIDRTDRFTFNILESFSQPHFGRTVPLAELSLEVQSLPYGTSRQDVEDELIRISTMVCPGADPEIEEGGGHTYRVGIGAARVGRSCLCAR